MRHHITNTKQSVEHFIFHGLNFEKKMDKKKNLLRWMVMRVTLKRGEKKNTLFKLKISISCVHKIALGSYVVL